MRLRNGGHGYGLVTKALHWLTVAAIVGQFLLGAAMDVDHAVDRQEDQLRAEADRAEEAAGGQGKAAEGGSRPRTRRARTPSTSGTTTRRLRVRPGADSSATVHVAGPAGRNSGNGTCRCARGPRVENGR